jgi:hypothetical protein
MQQPHQLDVKKKEYEHALHIILEEGGILSARGEKIQCP